MIVPEHNPDIPAPPLVALGQAKKKERGASDTLMGLAILTVIVIALRWYYKGKASKKKGRRKRFKKFVDEKIFQLDPKERKRYQRERRQAEAEERRLRRELEEEDY